MYFRGIRSNFNFCRILRFIALLSKEAFDYTKWRVAHIDEGLNVRQLSKKAQEYSKIQR